MTTTPAYCQKCKKNTWKVSLGSEKQIHLTCVCGYNFVIKPPTPMEIMEKNVDSLRSFIEKMVVICPLTLICKTECTGAWYSCFKDTMKSGVNPWGNKIEIPGATSA